MGQLSWRSDPLLRSTRHVREAGAMARVTVFGAGAMGTAVAMHAARRGLDVALWANPFDEKVLARIREDGRHPNLPEHIPSQLAIHGPDELDKAAAGCEIAVMGAG